MFRVTGVTVLSFLCGANGCILDLSLDPYTLKNNEQISRCWSLGDLKASGARTARFYLWFLLHSNPRTPSNCHPFPQPKCLKRLVGAFHPAFRPALGGSGSTTNSSGPQAHDVVVGGEAAPERHEFAWSCPLAFKSKNGWPGFVM